jgi:hypothetical protein
MAGVTAPEPAATAMCRASRSLGNPLHQRTLMVTRGRLNGRHNLFDFAGGRPSTPCAYQAAFVRLVLHFGDKKTCQPVRAHQALHGNLAHF